MPSDAVLTALIDHSPLRDYDWPDHRGIAPQAYYKGMILAFARAHAMLRSLTDGSGPPAGFDAAAWAAGKRAVGIATASTIGTTTKDVLAWYAAQLQAQGAPVATASDKLIAVFAIMIGLGMRESSGQFCTGADTPESRGEPTTPENAEAGLLQVSWDSIGTNADRRAVFDGFKARTDLLAVFSQGVACHGSDLVIHGSGDQADFQKAMKNNPLFATLYTAMYLRSARGHWGPINKRKAEVRSDAVMLLKEVRRLLEAP